jgi:hypothetical protein
MTQKGLLFTLIFMTISFSFAQQKEVHVKWVEEEISIDGLLDEDVWRTADVATDFWQYFPTDTLLSTSQTEIRMLFDEKLLEQKKESFLFKIRKPMNNNFY